MAIVTYRFDEQITGPVWDGSNADEVRQAVGDRTDVAVDGDDLLLMTRLHGGSVEEQRAVLGSLVGPGDGVIPSVTWPRRLASATLVEG